MVRTAIVVMCLGVLAGCPGGDDSADPDAITVTMADGGGEFTTIGRTRALSAMSVTLDGIEYYPYDTVWASADPAIATVSAAGEVTGVAEGTVEIIATSEEQGHKTGRIDLEVYGDLAMRPGPRIAVTNSTTCALAEDGRAICWGQNLYGVAGHPPYFTSPTPPAPVTDERAFTSVTIGAEVGCGLTADGEIYCWGSNSDGVLGVGPNPPTPPDGEFLGQRPLRVASDEQFVAVSAGLSHVCALNAAGKAFCWGSNLGGELETNEAPHDCGTVVMARQCARAPIPVAEEHTFVTLSAHAKRTCGLTPNRTFYCWGTLDTEEGGGSDAAPWIDTATGDYHRCAIDDVGAAWCWGANLGGLGSMGPYDGCFGLNLGTHDCFQRPRRVAGGLTFSSIAPGVGRTCGVTVAGDGYCWGGNDLGELGDGTVEAAAEPTAVVGGHDFEHIVTDPNHTCGLATDGTVWCWGGNEYGQLGVESTETFIATPTRAAPAYFP